MASPSPTPKPRKHHHHHHPKVAYLPAQAAAPANPAPAPGNPQLTNGVAAATQTDGSIRTYSGTYTVASGVIVSANITQTS